jgi:diazepam-binding inhibitor (GABA receptor modulating acyl-CoA-binding protein)
MRNQAVSTGDIRSRDDITNSGKRRDAYNTDISQTVRGEIMSDLKTDFDAAVAESKTLANRPDNQTLLKIYSLFKQATEGDVSGRRPGFTDLIGRAKYDAWANLQGTSGDAAKQAYIDLIKELKG